MAILYAIITSIIIGVASAFVTAAAAQLPGLGGLSVLIQPMFFLTAIPFGLWLLWKNASKGSSQL